MSLILVHLLIVLSICLNSSESSTFNCNSESICSSVNNCTSNESCFINCDGNRVCANKTFHCPSNAPCIINCGTNENQTHSCYKALFTTQNDTEIINITTEGTHSMRDATVDCPQLQNVRKCFIYSLDGASQLSNLNIYAAQSYNDIYIHCNNPNCYTPSNYPIIYCSNYSVSCEIELQSLSNNAWQCTPNTSLSICNDMSLINPTINNTDAILINEQQLQTISPSWIDMVGNIQTVEREHNNNEAILIGVILGAATCCLFCFICVMAVYFNSSKSETLKSIVVMDSRKELERLGSGSKSTSISAVTTSVSAHSKFVNKRRASNLPKPKPRGYSHHKINVQEINEINEIKKEKYTITPTPDTIITMAMKSVCDFFDEDPTELVQSEETPYWD